MSGPRRRTIRDIAAARPRSRWTERLERIGLIPVTAIALGLALAWLAEPIGGEWGGLAGVGGLALLSVGFVLLLVWGAVWMAFRVLRGVALQTGVAVNAPVTPPPVDPPFGSVAWRVAFQDGRSVTAYTQRSSMPAWLACDGRWIDIKWPRRGDEVFEDRSYEFLLAGHTARLEWRIFAPTQLKVSGAVVGPGIDIDVDPDGDLNARLDAVGRVVAEAETRGDRYGDILSPERPKRIQASSRAPRKL